ncbi:Hint domain-containing protein [Ruegeria arenilitoris]|uniref:Hint domain-containing protein n=1 Tax=Ruegeria arenilitoris TaxID=1173585 RepID=UPI00147D6DF7|nr:Hint domain-containing protein [Ruegeria arenilitoris]
MPFDATLHTVNTTGGGDLVVQGSTTPAIISGLTVSFDGGVTFQPYTYLGQGNYRGSGESGEFIQVGGQIYAWDTDNPTGPMTTGNWQIGETELDPTDPPCFVAGTLIETESGPRAVEDLVVGDRVCVSNDETLPIVWVGKKTLNADVLRANPKFRPVHIRRDALGPGLPNRDLCVSPQHRIVLDGWRAELLFGEPMVFSAAVHLVNDNTIRQVQPVAPVEYYHIACPRHAILRSHGLKSESLFLGGRALNSFDRRDIEELRALFPELIRQETGAQRTRLRCLKRPEVIALQGMLPH